MSFRGCVIKDRTLTSGNAIFPINQKSTFLDTSDLS
jgi:hypothetical protein